MFEDAHPLEILRWAGEEFGDGLVVTASFGDAVLVHLVSQAIPDADIVLLDTGYLFAETEWYAEQLRQRYRLNLRTVRPLPGAQPDQWMTDTEACCQARKVEPMQRVLAGKTAWVSGLRRDDTPSRARTPVVHVDLLSQVTKINPIAAWTDADVEHYKAMELLPDHPLADRGYPSIGCWPCTRPVGPGEDARAGRWAGSDKDECGLHIVTARERFRRRTVMGVEDIKRTSGFLRGTLPEELADGTDAFSQDNTVVLKFHGIYQQDDRDVRRERASQKLPLDYSCMVRASVPGGKLTAEQWLALDRVAELADGTIRLTTRQGVQFHVVHKGDLHQLVRGINESLLTTLAACGDVVRNIMGSPWPDERQTVVEPLVDALVARFRPQTPSYWELWVDGDKAVTAQPAPLPYRGPKGRKRSPEPIYGDVYLPRKFKITVAWPGDNNVDVLANDVGVVPTLTGGVTGDVTGYNVYVGGGLGMSHSREDDTYPLLAEPLGWVTPEHVVDVVEAVVTTQRDFGNRDDRHRARLKYLVEERGHRVDAGRGRSARRVHHRPGGRPAALGPRGVPRHTRRRRRPADPLGAGRRPRRRPPAHGAA